MALILSQVTDTLQKVIAPYVRDNFPKETILLDKVRGNSEVEFMNDNFYVPLRTSRHGGVHNLANDGSKLVTGKASFDQASVGVKILTGTFDISKLAIDATKSRKGAVVNQLTYQAETLAKDFARNVNRQLYQDGSGVIAEVAGSAATAAVPVVVPTSSVDDGRAQDRYGTINGDIDPTKYIAAGAVLGVGTAAAAVGTVSSVAKLGSGGTAGTVTFTAGIAHAANDSIYLVDGDGAGAGTAELTGLGAALSSGTADYASVPRSTLGWTPQFSTASEALSLSRLEDLYLAAAEYAMTGDTYVWLMNRSLYKKYGDILTAMRRTVNAMDLGGGWSGLEFEVGNGRVAVVLDYDVPDGEAILVNLDTMVLAQVSEMGWLEDPKGGGLIRRDDYITYQSTMAWFVNLICTAPAANAKAMRLTD